MKKIINNPANFVEESIDIKSHPDVYALAKDITVVMRANKVSQLNSNWRWIQYQCLLDMLVKDFQMPVLLICILSPSVNGFSYKNADNGNGAYVIGNYGGDVMNLKWLVRWLKQKELKQKK